MSSLTAAHGDIQRIVKLDSNENPYGMSPHALMALTGALASASRYPDASGGQLRAAVATHNGVDMNQVVLGNGSNELLEMASTILLREGTSVVASRHSFAVYGLVSRSRAARLVEVESRQLAVDLDAMANAVDNQTRLVFLGNPNNPTGSFAEGEAVRSLLAALPPTCVLVLDEAYIEFVSDAKRYDATTWLAHYPNLIILRTFSKAYGLAGLRMGYALTSSLLAAALERVRQPFNSGVLGQAAALAALGDQNFVRQTVALNSVQLERVRAELAAMGLRTVDSEANFVLVEVTQAAEVIARLQQRGIIVRPVANYGLPNHMRISIGTAEENEKMLSALSLALTPGVPA